LPSPSAPFELCYVETHHRFASLVSGDVVFGTTFADYVDADVQSCAQSQAPIGIDSIVNSSEML
jgi:hypothetical protein